MPTINKIAAFAFPFLILLSCTKSSAPVKQDPSQTNAQEPAQKPAQTAGPAVGPTPSPTPAPAPAPAQAVTPQSTKLYNPTMHNSDVVLAYQKESKNPKYAVLPFGKWGDQNLTRLSLEAVYFYVANERWGDFANTARNMPVIIDNQTYPANENYYQASKFDPMTADFTWAKNYAQKPGEKYSDFPKLVKVRLPGQKTPSWFNAKEVMWKSMVAKFKQHQNVRWMLLATGRSVIVEDTRKSGDKIWGAGSNGDGENRLGIFLMVMRQQLFAFGDISETMPQWLAKNLDAMNVEQIVHEIANQHPTY